MAKPEVEKRTITEADRIKAEDQIVMHHRTVDYDTREYPVEVIVDKFLQGLENDSRLSMDLNVFELSQRS